MWGSRDKSIFHGSIKSSSAALMRKRSLGINSGPSNVKSRSEPGRKLPFARDPYTVACMTCGYWRKAPHSALIAVAGSPKSDTLVAAQGAVSATDQGFHIFHNRLCGFLVVGARGLVATFDHVHPTLSIRYQLHCERFLHRVARTCDRRRITLVCKVIFHDIPRQLVREFKCLNEPLLLQIAQWAGFAKRNSVLQAR